MDTVLKKVVDIVSDILKNKGRPVTAIDNEKSLYEDGLGFDSMDTAGLSAALEQEFGSDPFMVGEFPRTISDIVKFYSK